MVICEYISGPEITLTPDIYYILEISLDDEQGGV